MTQKPEAERIKKITLKPSYKEYFNGKFYGVLRWHQLDTIWAMVIGQRSKGWYIYQTSSNIPNEKTRNKKLDLKIMEINEYLRQKHDEDYCGTVYVDDLEDPKFIKVFDPKNMGTACSIGGKAPLPEWVISQIPPEDMTINEEPQKYKKRWLGSLFSK